MIKLEVTIPAAEHDALCAELLIPASQVVRTECQVTFWRAHPTLLERTGNYEGHENCPRIEAGHCMCGFML